MEQNRIAMTLEEASKYTGIGRNTLRNLIAWDKLPVLRVGRKILIRTDMLDRFVELNEGRNLRKETDVKACRPKKG